MHLWDQRHLEEHQNTTLSIPSRLVLSGPLKLDLFCADLDMDTMYVSIYNDVSRFEPHASRHGSFMHPMNGNTNDTLASHLWYSYILDSSDASTQTDRVERLRSCA